jgi:hypothetical protein
MMKERLRVKGLVTVRVLDRDGNVKRRPQTWFRRLLRIPGRPMEQRFHNIVTREGDALIADALLASPAKTKVTSSSGYIQVGTGWTGNSTKTNTRCNTSTGSMKALDGGYPALKRPGEVPETRPLPTGQPLRRGHWRPTVSMRRVYSTGIPVRQTAWPTRR